MLPKLKAVLSLKIDEIKAAKVPLSIWLLAAAGIAFFHFSNFLGPVPKVVGDAFQPGSCPNSNRMEKEAAIP